MTRPGRIQVSLNASIQGNLLLLQDGKSVSRKQPFGVTLLLWLVLSLSAWGAVRLFAALRWWGVLKEFGARLSPPYLFVTGIGWVIVGGVLLWSLFRGKAWARLGMLVSIALWLMEYWIERVFFEAPRANLFFALTLSILLLIVTLASASNRKTKEFFVRSEEHEQPNEYTGTA